ncbi:BaeS Signal transduction histidine kinase [Burkholderiaceae bacterium]
MKTTWRQWLRGDWVALLPASFRADKMPFVFLCMMMLVVVSLTFSLFNPYRHGSTMQVGFALLILGLLWLMHRGVALNIVLGLMCFLSVAYLFNAARVSGGVFSLRLVWLMLVPVMAYYVMGPAHGLLWLLVSWLTTITLAWMTWSGTGIALPVSGDQQDFYAFASIAINCLTLMVVPLVYDRQHRRNLTESQTRQNELEQTRLDLEHTQALREHFIAAVSHELRTPMNAILGFNSLLMSRTSDKPRAQQLLEHTRQSADHLMTVINDVLDYSQFLSGRLNAQQEVFNLHATIGHAFDLFAPKVQSMSIAYQLEVAPGVPTWVSGDRHRLMQILVNLLGNALKFTAKGHVRLHVVVHADGLMFAVHDTGIGIATQDQANLFGRFAQASQDIQRQYGGNGLGLAISHGLVQLLGGHMGFESELGRGSRFWFTLPLRASSSPEHISSSDKPLVQADKAWRFLVVDDHRLNRLLVTQVLKNAWHQCTVVEAGDGLQALQALQTQDFDLVFMDLVMPELNGADATHALRAMPAPRGNTPVMGLTADVSPVDLANFRAAGINALLLKPFDPQHLVRESQALLLARPTPSD